MLWLKFIFIGLAATAMMDLHTYLHSKIFRTIPTSCHLTARWVGTIIHREKFTGKITEVAQWRHEGWLGWLGHYLMGVMMVSVFLALVGESWLQAPTLLPLLVYLCVLILFPFCVLQPLWGFGFFGAKTQDPTATRKRVLVAYMGFALGIYLSSLWVAHW